MAKNLDCADAKLIAAANSLGMRCGVGEYRPRFERAFAWGKPGELFAQNAKEVKGRGKKA